MSRCPPLLVPYPTPPTPPPPIPIHPPPPIILSDAFTTPATLTYTSDLTINPSTTYTGQIMTHSHQPQPHGYGVMKMVNSHGREATYRGEFCRGKKHGYGIMTYHDNSTYEGTFEHNYPHGEGVYTSATKGITSGQWKRDGLHGYAVTIAPADESKPYTQQYEGQYKEGHRVGYGVSYHSHLVKQVEEMYLGQWEGGKKHGDGINYKHVAKEENLLIVRNGNKMDMCSYHHGKAAGIGIRVWNILFNDPNCSIVGGDMFIGCWREDVDRAKTRGLFVFNYSHPLHTNFHYDDTSIDCFNKYMVQKYGSWNSTINTSMEEADQLYKLYLSDKMNNLLDPVKYMRLFNILGSLMKSSWRSLSRRKSSHSPHLPNYTRTEKYVQHLNLIYAEIQACCDCNNNTHLQQLEIKNSIGKKEPGNGVVYYGELDSWNDPHGFGILIRSNGDKIAGQWEHGLVHGSAICYKHQGDKIEGLWKRGVCVLGVYTFHSGEMYAGDLGYNLRFHGHGTCTHTGGNRFYEGQYHLGKQHGYGKRYTLKSPLLPPNENGDVATSPSSREYAEVVEGEWYDGKLTNLAIGYQESAGGYFLFENGRFKTTICNYHQGSRSKVKDRFDISMTCLPNMEILYTDFNYPPEVDLSIMMTHSAPPTPTSSSERESKGKGKWRDGKKKACFIFDGDRNSIVSCARSTYMTQKYNIDMRQNSLIFQAASNYHKYLMKKEFKRKKKLTEEAPNPNPNGEASASDDLTTIPSSPSRKTVLKQIGNVILELQYFAPTRPLYSTSPNPSPNHVVAALCRRKGLISRIQGEYVKLGGDVLLLRPYGLWWWRTACSWGMSCIYAYTRQVGIIRIFTRPIIRMFKKVSTLFRYYSSSASPALKPSDEILEKIRMMATMELHVNMSGAPDS